MSFIWIIVAGLIPSATAKLLMPHHRAGGLFILGFSGSIIAALLQYSENQPIGFIVPLTGAIILLVVYALSTRSKVAAKADRDDFRRAA